MKRFFDIICALIALTLLSPIFLLTGLMIYISNPGPILYKAKRVGKFNEVFSMFKFRSMRVEKGKSENKLTADGSRIFPFGRFIRRTKLDELPQIVNILIGDMSIVGPRPASIDQVNLVRVGKNTDLSAIKPGLTSPSALYDYMYGDRITDEAEYRKKVLPTRLALDIEYLNHQSFFYDIQLILLTVICIFIEILNLNRKGVIDFLIGKANESYYN